MKASDLLRRIVANFFDIEPNHVVLSGEMSTKYCLYGANIRCFVYCCDFKELLISSIGMVAGKKMTKLTAEAIDMAAAKDTVMIIIAKCDDDGQAESCKVFSPPVYDDVV